MNEIIIIILFLTRYGQSMNDDENGDLHTSVYNLLMTSKSIAGDVTMARQLWRYHVNNDIELVIYRFYWQRYSRPVVLEDIT